MNEHVIQDILLDFILSREAKLCTPATLDYYERMLAPYIESLDGQIPSARNVRRFLTDLRNKDLSPATIHAHARAIRAFLRFAHGEGYLDEVQFEMPRLVQKKVKSLSEEQIRLVLSVCDLRDKALVSLLVDSGIRRGEAVALTWSDIDFDVGSVIVRSGKGGKERVTFIGAKTRRLLLRWRRKNPHDRVFPLKGSGLASVMDRLSRKSGVRVSAHRLRHTFATLSLRNGMDLLSLQRMLGHSTLDMVRIYAEQSTEDLSIVHGKAAPVDRLLC